MFTIFVLSGAIKNSSVWEKIELEFYEYQPFIKHFITKNMLFSKKYKVFDSLFWFKCKPITQNDSSSISSILEGRGKILCE